MLTGFASFKTLSVYRKLKPLCRLNSFKMVFRGALALDNVIFCARPAALTCINAAINIAVVNRIIRSILMAQESPLPSLVVYFLYIWFIVWFCAACLLLRIFGQLLYGLF